jgi:hypothetical protein
LSTMRAYCFALIFVRFIEIIPMILEKEPVPEPEPVARSTRSKTPRRNILEPSVLLSKGKGKGKAKGGGPPEPPVWHKTVMR